MTDPPPFPAGNFIMNLNILSLFSLIFFCLKYINKQEAYISLPYLDPLIIHFSVPKIFGVELNENRFGRFLGYDEL